MEERHYLQVLNVTADGLESIDGEKHDAKGEQVTGMRLQRELFRIRMAAEANKNTAFIKRHGFSDDEVEWHSAPHDASQQRADSSTHQGVMVPLLDEAEGCYTMPTITRRRQRAMDAIKKAEFSADDMEVEDGVPPRMKKEAFHREVLLRIQEGSGMTKPFMNEPSRDLFNRLLREYGPPDADGFPVEEYPDSVASGTTGTSCTTSNASSRISSVDGAPSVGVKCDKLFSLVDQFGPPPVLPPPKRSRAGREGSKGRRTKSAHVDIHCVAFNRQLPETFLFPVVDNTSESEANAQRPAGPRGEVRAAYSDERISRGNVEVAAPYAGTADDNRQNIFLMEDSRGLSAMKQARLPEAPLPEVTRMVKMANGKFGTCSGTRGPPPFAPPPPSNLHCHLRQSSQQPHHLEGSACGSRVVALSTCHRRRYRSMGPRWLLRQARLLLRVVGPLLQCVQRQPLSYVMPEQLSGGVKLPSSCAAVKRAWRVKERTSLLTGKPSTLKMVQETGPCNPSGSTYDNPFASKGPEWTHQDSGNWLGSVYTSAPHIGRRIMCVGRFLHDGDRRHVLVGSGKPPALRLLSLPDLGLYR